MADHGPESANASDDDDPVAAAAVRLDRAVSRVSRRLDDLNARLVQAEADAAAARDSDVDRARLAAALDEARANEAALAQAAQDAGDALDAAMVDLRAVLDAEHGA